MSPEKNHVQRKLENWKRHFMKCTRITQSQGGYLTFKKDDFYTVFYFKTSRFFSFFLNFHFLAAMGSDPPPPQRNVKLRMIFFTCSLSTTSKCQILQFKTLFFPQFLNKNIMTKSKMFAVIGGKTDFEIKISPGAIVLYVRYFGLFLRLSWGLLRL